VVQLAWTHPRVRGAEGVRAPPAAPAGATYCCGEMVGERYGGLLLELEGRRRILLTHVPPAELRAARRGAVVRGTRGWFEGKGVSTSRVSSQQVHSRYHRVMWAV
jgi:hypothetical protein